MAILSIPHILDSAEARPELIRKSVAKLEQIPAAWKG